MKGGILEPCIYIFNTEGASALPEITAATNISNNIFVFERKEQANLHTDTYSDNVRKRKQLNDFYDMLKTVHSMDIKGPLALMEDDFVFCPYAVGHLARITTFMSRKNYSGIRFSFGLNGVIIHKSDIPGFMNYMEANRKRAFPTDWLLEEFVNKYVPMGQEYFKERVFYTYRYQLMEHIGVVTSVGNNRNEEQNKINFPQCYETQTQSQLMFMFFVDACPNSLFYPCDETSAPNDFVHDSLPCETLPASAIHSLQELQTIKAVLGALGENCDTICAKSESVCAPNYFPYINRCDEMRKHYSSCECKKEGVIDSRAPYFDGKYCIIGNRRSKFRCGNAHPSERRLCPCKPK
ncbi:predicted protein [Naegleria gruberi]|uniref:Predicted protein n=1 Tax=Naegleria gruberi TaxID=5762 RepID=D2VYA3_NAEGR|nr:uncharacterized protein NAEGRDRAFT_74047 [Naegleria gruberi]EFC38214.1 predicted protein [Naegleria gruberi]|eukprot:XP_002670958.1 predicted protein [Naegleria gruberi strain NEG-M]